MEDRCKTLVRPRGPHGDPTESIKDELKAKTQEAGDIREMLGDIDRYEIELANIREDIEQHTEKDPEGKASTGERRIPS